MSQKSSVAQGGEIVSRALMSDSQAGLRQCTPHGLRNIGAVRAAEAGASEHELMAMFGWEDANMARAYTR